jgi:hypothetical protein
MDLSPEGARAERRRKAEELRARIERQAELMAAAESGELDRPAEHGDGGDVWDDVRRLLDERYFGKPKPKPEPASTGLYAAPNHRGPRRLRPADPNRLWNDALRRAHRAPRTKDPREQFPTGAAPPEVGQ